jgi:steroid 5-alpha reductase family enzyme
MNHHMLFRRRRRVQPRERGVLMRPRENAIIVMTIIVIFLHLIVVIEGFSLLRPQQQQRAGTNQLRPPTTTGTTTMTGTAWNKINHDRIITRSRMPGRESTMVSQYSPYRRHIATSLRGGGSGSGRFMVPPSLLMDNGNPICQSIGIYAVADLVVGLLISMVTGSHVHLDLIGTGVFAVAALPYVGSPIGRIRWSAVAIVVWGAKLALFLFVRATQVQRDNRLTNLLSTPGGAFQFWFATFVWNVLTSLPFLLGLGSDLDDPLALSLGGAMYLFGLTIESLADIQKYAFKRQQVSPPGGGQFCNVGLWKYSQHPNWFGNLLLWTGVLVMNLPALLEPFWTVHYNEPLDSLAGLVVRLWGLRRVVLACLGPCFLWLLFNGQASGSVTNAVELANAKYGKDPQYAEYIKDVPLIVPKLKFWCKVR